MTYTLSPTSKPGFPVIKWTLISGLADDNETLPEFYSRYEEAKYATFTDAIKDEATKYILARVPTAYGVGWIICGECEGTFSPSALLTALEHGFINVPSEAWT